MSGAGPIDRLRMDRTALRIVPLGAEPSDAAYWRARPDAERWEAIELAREIVYGRAIAAARLQRVLAVARLAAG